MDWKLQFCVFIILSFKQKVFFPCFVCNSMLLLCTCLGELNCVCYTFPQSVWQYLMPSCYTYTFLCHGGAASQAGDDAPGTCLTSGFKGSTNIQRCTLLFVPHLQCTSSFVFTYLPYFLRFQRSFLFSLHSTTCTMYLVSVTALG